MPVPPQRSASWNPMRDVVGRVREIAGHSAGGSLTDEARRALPGAGDRASRQFFTGGWTTVSATDEVTDDGWTAIDSSLSGLTIGGPRRKGDFRLLLTGWSPMVAGGRVDVNFGTLVSSGGALITDGGDAALTFRWWIGGGAPWDPLPTIQIGFPATALTDSPTVQLSLDYEA